ncbi:hypothetical protein MTR_8g099335 [Medicago truncatula]|uniref:Uncharacterized protein n=1 Tax=Medicago truncatula TaxID=3880 RepID=A0A072TUT9_MEDTR|nr:hypothetical protein MTR_8g099335 [Medicago truncatula]
MGIDSEKDYSGKFAMGSSVILSHLLLREENYYEDYLAKMRGTQSERMKILYHSSFPPYGSSSFVSADSMGWNSNVYICGLHIKRITDSGKLILVYANCICIASN